MGAITDIVKRYVPASYKALVGATNTYDYNISDLQGLANYVQYRLFSTIPDSSNEAVVWNPNELELLGMLTTLEFIPAAIDYWGDQLESQTTTGTNEDVGYFDRRPQLWNVFEKLSKSAEDLGTKLGVSLYAVKAVVPKVSYGDNGRNILVTSDPEDFDPAFSEATINDYIPWSTP